MNGLTSDAWLAGLIEGEGWFEYNGSVGVGVQMVDRDTIDRAAGLMGLGVSRAQVRVREAKKNRHKSYRFMAWGAHADAVLNKILPYMGERRIGQINEVLAKWHARPNKRKKKEAS